MKRYALQEVGVHAYVALRNSLRFKPFICLSGDTDLSNIAFSEFKDVLTWPTVLLKVMLSGNEGLPFADSRQIVAQFNRRAN